MTENNEKLEIDTIGKAIRAQDKNLLVVLSYKELQRLQKTDPFCNHIIYKLQSKRLED